MCTEFRTFMPFRKVTWCTDSMPCNFPSGFRATLHLQTVLQGRSETSTKCHTEINDSQPHAPSGQILSPIEVFFLFCFVFNRFLPFWMLELLPWNHRSVLLAFCRASCVSPPAKAPPLSSSHRCLSTRASDTGVFTPLRIPCSIQTQCQGQWSPRRRGSAPEEQNDIR